MHTGLFQFIGLSISIKPGVDLLTRMLSPYLKKKKKKKSYIFISNVSQPIAQSHLFENPARPAPPN
jgi:hypothetical protein